MRTFDPSKHLVNLDAVEWAPMRDEYDTRLEGIRGKAGACGPALGGEAIGVDLIEMASGSAFPPHVHVGSHILYVLEGAGVVTIDQRRYDVTARDSIWIAAEQAHAVSAPSKPCVFLAFGYPHRDVDALDRMQLVQKAKNQAQ